MHMMRLFYECIFLEVFHSFLKFTICFKSSSIAFFSSMCLTINHQRNLKSSYWFDYFSFSNHRVLILRAVKHTNAMLCVISRLKK